MPQSESLPQNTQPSYRAPTHDPDEINLLEYAYALVKAKWWIIGLTALGFVGGYVEALIKGPVYVADAVIAPRETETNATPNLSGLGMFGGIVASQLNIGGNASLDKINVVLDSKRFNAEMMVDNRLLPYLFPKKWDSAGKGWTIGFVPPEPMGVGAFVKAKLIKHETKGTTMTIKATTADSAFTDTLIRSCLRYLDLYIRSAVQQDAKRNRDYLEQQLMSITDPLLRGKVQELIAKEVEKMMVVSNEAFTTIDPPYVSKVFKAKRLYPKVFGLGMLLLTALAAIVAHAFSSAQKTEEDRRLIQKIYQEAIRPFRQKT